MRFVFRETAIPVFPSKLEQHQSSLLLLMILTDWKKERESDSPTRKRAPISPSLSHTNALKLFVFTRQKLSKERGTVLRACLPYNTKLGRSAAIVVFVYGSATIQLFVESELEAAVSPVSRSKDSRD